MTLSDDYINQNYLLLCRIYLKKNGVLTVDNTNIQLVNTGSGYNNVIVGWNFNIPLPTIENFQIITEQEIIEEKQSLIEENSIQHVYNISKNFNSSSYAKINTISLKNKNILGVKIINTLDSSDNTFAIRLYDKVNNKILCENVNLTTLNEDQFVGLITDSTLDSIIEIQFKNTNSKKNVYIENIIIYF